MAGIRLRHKAGRRGSAIVVHPTRKLRAPMLCGKCGTTHVFKTIHLDFDDEGCTIVSKEVFQRLREAGLPDLTVENEVLKPPARTLNLGEPIEINPRYDVVEVSGGRLTVLKNKLFKPRVKRYSNG